jgi:hypothetical protein
MGLQHEDAFCLKPIFPFAAWMIGVSGGAKVA